MSPMKDDDLQVPPALLKAIFNTDCAFLNVLHEHDTSGLAPRVPLEILEVIFDLVWDDAAGVGTLCSVAQVCRAFAHHVTSTLYDTILSIMLYSSPTLDTGVGRFATTVTSNAHLASLLRGRKTGADAQSTSRHVLGVYASILGACKRLDALDIYSNETMMAGFARAPSITRLAIRELHASTWLQLLEPIRQLHVDGIYTAASWAFCIRHSTRTSSRLSGFFDHTTALGRVYAFFRAPVLEKVALFIETSGMSPDVSFTPLGVTKSAPYNYFGRNCSS